MKPLIAVLPKPFFRPDPPRMVRCYVLWDRNAAIYAVPWLAPFLRLANWYRGARWCLEEWSVEWEIGQLVRAYRQSGVWGAPRLLKDGDYYKNHWFHTGRWADEA